MSEPVRVICSTCKADPAVVRNPNGEDEAICTICGQRDKLQVAVQIAQEFAADAAARGFQATIGQAARGKLVLKFTPPPLPERTFKWLVV